MGSACNGSFIRPLFQQSTLVQMLPAREERWVYCSWPKIASPGCPRHCLEQGQRLRPVRKGERARSSPTRFLWERGGGVGFAPFKRCREGSNLAAEAIQLSTMVRRRAAGWLAHAASCGYRRPRRRTHPLIHWEWPPRCACPCYEGSPPPHALIYRRRFLPAGWGLALKRDVSFRFQGKGGVGGRS